MTVTLHLLLLIEFKVYLSLEVVLQIVTVAHDVRHRHARMLAAIRRLKFITKRAYSKGNIFVLSYMSWNSTFSVFVDLAIINDTHLLCLRFEVGILHGGRASLVAAADRMKDVI
jgi:hypothetical protein